MSPAVPRTITLRTRGGPRHGYGNVYRLLGVAEFLRRAGVPRVRFLLEGPQEVAGIVRRAGFEAWVLDEGLDPAEEARALAELEPSDLCIVEMLDLDVARQRVLKARTRRLVIFDDLLDQRYEADLVVCGQDMKRDGDAVLRGPHTTLFSGYEWFLLPQAFRGVRKTVAQQPDRIAKVLVAFGGGSYDLAWLKTARAAARCAGDLAFTFVLGPAASGALHTEVAELCPGARILGEGDLPREFAAHDLAITSAGYLKIEAAATGTPAITLATQWHQIPLGEAFSEAVGAPYLGVMPYVGAGAIEVAIRTLRDPRLRRAIVARGLDLIDGEGLDRLLPHLLKTSDVAEASA